MHFSLIINFSCLMRRGADFNREDYRGQRPDDLGRCYDKQNDCQDIIITARRQRAQRLTDIITEVTTLVQKITHIFRKMKLAWFVF